LEKLDGPSELVVDPTVMADPALAGDLLQASVLSFPAATTIVMPAATALLTARFKELEKPPPRDILATHALFSGQLFITCSIPLITPVVLPLPLLDSTFGGR
jgi:hypothetical protein